jgi:hypothetical protein
MDRRHVHEMSRCHEHYYHLLQTLLKRRDKSITVYKQYQNQHYTCRSPHTHVSTRKRHLLPSSRFVTNNELLFSLLIKVFHFTRNTQILLDWHIVLKMPPTELRTYNEAYINIHKHTTDSHRLHSYGTRTKTETRHPLQRQEARAQQRERSFRRCQRNIWKWNRVSHRQCIRTPNHSTFQIVVSSFKKSYNNCKNSSLILSIEKGYIQSWYINVLKQIFVNISSWRSSEQQQLNRYKEEKMSVGATLKTIRLYSAILLLCSDTGEFGYVN